MKTLLVGLGNPILGDDGVGWRVVESIQTQLESDSRMNLAFRPMDSKKVEHLCPVEFEFLSLGGLSLMEHILGYEHVIIVDAMETGHKPVGSVAVFPLDALPDPMAGHSASIHDATLMTALRTAEVLGADIPRKVDIVAIEAQNVYDFTEELSQPVAEAVPLAAQKVFELLEP